MKFLLTVYARPAPDAEPRYPALDHAAFVTAARETGELLDGHVLADPTTGIVVRVRDGVTTVADGCHPDCPIRPAAYYLVDCENRERAVGLAATIPAAGCDAIEVRPVMLAAGMEM